MSEAQLSLPAFSLPFSAMEALRATIQARTPWLHVMEIVTDHEHPFLRVKDTANGIIVGLSSEAEYRLYIGIVDQQGGYARE